MQAETSLDLRYNIAAMYIAILKEGITTPEQAFSVLEKTRYKISSKDIEDMIRMQQKGETYKEIAKIYGYSESAIKNKVYRYKKKTNSSGNLKRS